MMKVKVQFGSDIRKWRYPDSKRYQNLLAFIKQTFGFVDEKQFYVQFEDDEGDRLTLTSENDFEDAFSSAEQEGRKSLKIFIIKGSIEDSHNNNNDVLHSFSIASPVSTSSRISSQLLQEPEKPKIVNEKVQNNNSPKKPEIEVKIENENEKEEKLEEPSQQNNSDVSWRQMALDFLQNKEIQTLLPQLVRRFISELRKEQQKPISNQKNLLTIIHETLGEDQFKPIVKHALYSQKIVFILPRIVEKLQLYQGLLLTFNEDAIASWVPRLINTLINSFSHFENIDIELDVDPMCNPFFSFPFGDCNLQNDYCSGNSDKDKVHSGVICDSCKCNPITGTRYKCSVCSNYDLCSNCEASGKHDISHPLLKITSPVRSYSNQDYIGLHEFLKWSSQHGKYHGHHSRGQNYWSQYCRRRYCNDQKSGDDYLNSCPRRKCNSNNNNNNNNSKVSAQFIEDVNIPDRSFCPVDTVLTKTWKVKNNGDVEWGNDVELVFLKGNECLVLEKRHQVPNAKPGEQIDISAIIKTPNKSGRYCTYFKLKKNDVFFGPSLWVELFAVPENDQVLQSTQSKVICVCGEKLTSINPQEAYNGSQVFCDVCNRRCSSDPIIYHCPRNRNTSHPEGYDMCKKCVDNQNLMIHESNQNNSNNAQKVFVDIQLDIPNVQQNNNNNVSNVSNNDINSINNVSNVSNNNANNINNVDNVNVNVNNNENVDQNIVHDEKNEDQIKFDDFDPIPLNIANDENRSEILSSNNSEPEIIEMKDLVVDNQNVNENENENENENHQNQQNEEDNFEFKKQLDSLLEMGFYDVETNKRLLIQRKGDILNVVQELLQA